MRLMPGAILRLILSLRLYLPVFTAPYALLWASAPASGGWLMVVGHTLLVWYYALSLDSAFLSAGLDPRLSLLPDRHLTAAAPIDITRTIAGCGVAVSALFLLLAGEPRLSLMVAAGGAGVSLLVRSALGTDGIRRFVLAEWVWAAVILMGPCLLIAAPGWSPQQQGLALQASGDIAEPMSPAVIAATALGALMLGAWVLLCMRRDEAADRELGLVTTATALGRPGTLTLIALWTLGAMTLAIWGVSMGWWGWLVAALVGWAAAMVAWLSSSGADRAGALAWAGVQAIVGLALLREIAST